MSETLLVVMKQGPHVTKRVRFRDESFEYISDKSFSKTANKGECMAVNDGG